MKRKNLKRGFTLVLGLAMAVGLSACAGKEGSKKNGGDEKATPLVLKKSTRGNPIAGFDDQGNVTYGGDPAVLVDGDKVYLYTGHDMASAGNGIYVIPEWLCYSSDDLITWTYEGVVLKSEDISWTKDNTSSWAAQVVKHKDPETGKDLYYIYTCSWDQTSQGKQSIGVAVSESPKGPFVDIGKPLVSGAITTDQTSDWNDIDPTVWMETVDGEEHIYLYWGNGKNYLCELNSDMISVKDRDGDGTISFGPGKDIISKTPPKEFTEAPWLYRRQDEEGNYYGDYYLFYAQGWREKMAYARIDDLFEGSFTGAKTIMEPTATSNTNHMSVFDFKGETYFVYHNGSLTGGDGFKRVANITKIQFKEDGSIEQLSENALGITESSVYQLKDLEGNIISHNHFENSSSDDSYPYLNIAITNKVNKNAEDSYWLIENGKFDPEDENMVSLESYNKPGLFLTAAQATANLAQATSANFDKSQSFKTVEGLAGKGVSFESVSKKGKYLMINGNGKLVFGDGSDAKACSFLVEEVEMKE